MRSTVLRKIVVTLLAVLVTAFAVLRSMPGAVEIRVTAACVPVDGTVATFRGQTVLTDQFLRTFAS